MKKDEVKTKESICKRCEWFLWCNKKSEKMVFCAQFKKE